MKKILVIDFGSQYTQLIARRLRELNIYSEVRPWDEVSSLEDVEGFVLSGGPESVSYTHLTLPTTPYV